MPEKSTVTIERPDDDHVDIYVGDELIAGFNHDDHGWSGMDAGVALATKLGKALGANVEDA